MNEGSRRSKVIIFSAYVALVISILFVALTACEPAETSKTSTPNAVANTDPAEQTATAKFRACVNDKGTAPEKVAARQVTKVTGVDKLRGYLDMPKVFTSYSGGMARHGSDGVLIASAFATCYTSENGLVAVYDRDGHVLANGEF